MNPILIESLGLIAGICTTFCTIPQIIKIVRTHSTNSLSLWTYIIVCLGVILWLIYGYLIHSVALIIANFLALLFNGTILIMKLYWKNQ